MSGDYIEYCKRNFYHFTYYLLSNEDLCSTNSLKLYPGKFLNENSLKDYFHFYFLFSKNRYNFIEEQNRKIGLSTFFTYFLYFKTFSSLTNSVYITQPQNIKLTIDKITEFKSIFRSVFYHEGFYNELQKKYIFENGSTISFLSDVTYKVTNDVTYDLLIYDNAKLKNESKFTELLERLLNNLIAEKAIINPNIQLGLKDSEQYKQIKKEFKRFINFIKVDK